MDLVFVIVWIIAVIAKTLGVFIGIFGVSIIIAWLSPYSSFALYFYSFLVWIDEILSDWDEL